MVLFKIPYCNVIIAGLLSAQPRRFKEKCTDLIHFPLPDPGVPIFRLREDSQRSKTLDPIKNDDVRVDVFFPNGHQDLLVLNTHNPSPLTGNFLKPQIINGKLILFV